MLKLEWTEKNENRLILIGALVGAVLITIFAIVVAKHNRSTPEPAPSSTAT